MLAETPKLLLLGKENLGVSPMPVSIGIQVLGNGNPVTYPFATKVRIRRPSNLNYRNAYLIDFYFKDCRRGGLLSDNSSLPECNLSPEPNPGVLMIFFFLPFIVIITIDTIFFVTLEREAVVSLLSKGGVGEIRPTCVIYVHA